LISHTAIQKAWITIWELAAVYHRYEVEGMENLLGEDEHGKQAVLIAGYHGRALAVDLCILSVRLKQRLGYFPHCFVHRSLKLLPGATQAIDALGFVTHDDEAISRAVENGEHILLPPGGASEGMRTYHDNYQVRWPSYGYAKLAVRHGLPIVPVACAGADDTYIGLLDGDKIVRRLGLSRKWAWAPWTGLGPLGLYPFSPPFPARLYQVIGKPISTHDYDIENEDDIKKLHKLVKETVQDLLKHAQAQKEKRS